MPFREKIIESGKQDLIMLIEKHIFRLEFQMDAVIRGYLC